MSNTDIYDRVKKILKVGYKILVELEKEEPDMEEVQHFYNKRSAAIDRMDEIKDQQIDNLSQSEKEAARNLFTRLQLLEKQLNKNLAILSDVKQEALQQLDQHTKAKNSYTRSSDQYQGQISKIVDLKSRG